MAIAIGVLVVLVFFVLIFLGSSVRVLREYERGVIFRLGRLIAQKGPASPGASRAARPERSPRDHRDGDVRRASPTRFLRRRDWRDLVDCDRDEPGRCRGPGV